MNSILIVGSYATFTNELILKFYKENWRIYTLISSKKITKPAHVFEQYVYKYDSDSIKEIINSCRPNVILFSGAYDSLYQWEEESVKAEAMNYISGLSNLLMFAKLFGVRHFVYVSSETVFEDEYIVDINEDFMTSPNSFKAITISQGENLAMHFEQATQMEVTVARIAHMYGIPSNRRECTDLYSKMCVKTLISGRLKVNGKRIISALYIRDAVEALFLLIKAPERKLKLYHISSMEEVTEEAVARLIQDNYSRPVDIVDQTIGLRHRIILSNERFCREFSFQVRHSYKEMIPKIISYMVSHKNLFLSTEERFDINSLKYRIIRLFKKAFPFIECIVFFVPFFMINNRAVGSAYFDGINVYLLYVLLFAIIHGRQQAIFASLLSVIGYCFRQMYSLTGFSLLININTYIWVAQVFIIGLTVGHLRDKFREMETDKNERIEFLTERLNDITAINSSNTKIKNYYAEKLINSKESIGRIYDITSKLDKAETGEVLFTAALNTLSEIMMTQDVAIYLVANSKYCRLASSSSEKSRSLGKSIFIENYGMIFDVLERKQVFINRSLDTTLPMMASALFDDKNHMRILIFLWSIPYEQMTLYQANMLTIVGALIYSVIVRDADYMEALANRRYLPETSILQEDAFQEIINIHKHAGERGYTQYCILGIEGGSMTIKQLHDIMRPLLRETDYIGIQSDQRLAVLLTNTNEHESVFVRSRLQEKNIISYLER